MRRLLSFASPFRFSHGFPPPPLLLSTHRCHTDWVSLPYSFKKLQVLWIVLLAIDMLKDNCVVPDRPRVEKEMSRRRVVCTGARTGREPYHGTTRSTWQLSRQLALEAKKAFGRGAGEDGAARWIQQRDKPTQASRPTCDVSTVAPDRLHWISDKNDDHVSLGIGRSQRAMG